MPDPANPSKHHACIQVFRAQDMSPQLSTLVAATPIDLSCESVEEFDAAALGHPLAVESREPSLPPLACAPFKVPIA